MFKFRHFGRCRGVNFCKIWGPISVFDMQKSMEKLQKGKIFPFAKR